MGTKTQPSKFDCYANAEPNEPLFILLARDPIAPLLVHLWAELRVDDAIEKREEAIRCAEAMETWRKEHRPNKKPPNGFNLEVARERIVEASRKWYRMQREGHGNCKMEAERELDDAVQAFEDAIRTPVED